MIPRHKRAHRGGRRLVTWYSIFSWLSSPSAHDLEWNAFSNNRKNMARARLIAANLTMEHIWLARVINDKKALSPVGGDLREKALKLKVSWRIARLSVIPADWKVANMYLKNLILLLKKKFGCEEEHIDEQEFFCKFGIWTHSVLWTRI